MPANVRVNLSLSRADKDCACVKRRVASTVGYSNWIHRCSARATAISRLCASCSLRHRKFSRVFSTRSSSCRAWASAFLCAATSVASPIRSAQSVLHPAQPRLLRGPSPAELQRNPAQLRPRRKPRPSPGLAPDPTQRRLRLPAPPWDPLQPCPGANRSAPLGQGSNGRESAHQLADSKLGRG